MSIANNNVGVFLWNIAEQKDGFSFGEPWRQSEKALGIIVPILRKKDAKRDYVMVEETKKVNIEDTGSINRIRIVNDDKQNVFIRSGTILAGTTQERAVVSGVIIVPNSTMEAEVKCVHATKGIMSGAKMKVVKDYAPTIVMQALASRDQGKVWNSVRSFRASSNHMIGSSVDSFLSMKSAEDDLVATLDEVEVVKKDMENAIKDIPLVKNQVGAIIFDSVGIVGFEVFDSMKSWEALHKKVLAKYSDVLQQKQEEPLFQLRDEIIPEKIRVFIENIMACNEQQSSSTKVSTTMILQSPKIVGEYTVLGSNVIHIIAFKQEKQNEAPRTRPFESGVLVDDELRGTNDWGRRQKTVRPRYKMGVLGDYRCAKTSLKF